MQTDDVDVPTIAAEIANRAELIYQTWKNTGLNPSELIRFHSVTTDRFDNDQRPYLTSNLSKPRMPSKNTPASTSSSISRKMGENPSSLRSVSQSGSYYQNPPNQYSSYHSENTDALQQSRLSQYHLQQVQHQQHALSSMRSLNTSPKPYVSPSSQIVAAPLSPKVNYITPSSSNASQNSGLKFYGSPASSPSRTYFHESSSPPPPPERSSSYTSGEPAVFVQPQSSPLDLLSDPELEPSLRELVNTFVLEDKARNARTKNASTTIQDALQRFERQVAITSRTAASTDTIPHYQLSQSNTFPSSTLTYSSNIPLISSSAIANSIINTGKRYGSSRGGETVSGNESWPRVLSEQDTRGRRSISPSPPPVSQPGWNQAPLSTTSTWPLKNKQLLNVEKKNLNIQSMTTPINSTVAPSSTNYITTLEARIETPSSTDQSPVIPIRHKVVTVAPVEQEEERLMQVLRNGTMIEDGDHLLPSSQHNRSQLNAAASSNVVVSNAGQNRRPKFSISVTVDVEGQGSKNTPDHINVESSPSLLNSENINQLSVIDYAKVRYQGAQQNSKTSQRLDNYKNIVAKPIINGDGRVLMTRNRFETVDQAWRSSIQADEVDSTLPEFYKRKLRKMKKAVSPEPLAGAISALPHPELTDQQKSHIRERSQSPTALCANGVATRPFLTQGSVAERVMIFERAPVEIKQRLGASGVVSPERKHPTISTWRDPDDVRCKAQECVSSTPTTSRPHEPPAPAIDSKTQNYFRDAAANKENTTPNVPTFSTTPAVSNFTPSSSSTAAAASPDPTSVSTVGKTSAGPALSKAVPTAARRHVKAPKSLYIPRFYYPMGRPTTQASQEQILSQAAQCFKENGGQISMDNIACLMKTLQLPLYWKAPLFIAAGGEKVGHLSEEQFLDYWARVISTCHDSASRFVRILSRGLRNYLLSEDFVSLVQDVVDTHPGLTFLKEATEFHSRYVHTVIARIYYCVNRSWSGRITIPELRRSNLLQVISYLEEEEDINQITAYFSYEHFYVIYCKFWELDTDHDLFIDRVDLSKHNEGALSHQIIERIFSGAVTRGKSHKQERMGYQEFVWFLLSEEDKRHPTAIEYWFRCMDLDGDGYLSMFELEHFYKEQLQKQESLGMETVSFTDCVCQMSDWDRYAAEEYEILVAEEGGVEQQDDMLYGEDDELSVGVDEALDADIGYRAEAESDDCPRGFLGGGLSKSSPLSATVTNLSISDTIDMDDDYADYADSDDYQY